MFKGKNVETVGELRKMLEKWPDDERLDIVVHLLNGKFDEPIWAQIRKVDIPEDWTPMKWEHPILTLGEIEEF